MEQIQIAKSDFGNVLNTIEILITQVEQVLSQDEIAKKRMLDIQTGGVNGKTEEDYYEYLQERGIKIK